MDNQSFEGARGFILGFIFFLRWNLWHRLLALEPDLLLSAGNVRLWLPYNLFLGFLSFPLV